MEWLAAIIASLVSGLFGFYGSKNQSESNVQSVKDTNETNYKIAQETNAANVEQAELAYKRSLPTAQVQQMMQAGMSKYGALSALQGGGSYTAPTLQSAHFDAPQENVDFNALAERLQNIPANAQQANMVKEQTNALIQDQRRKDEELRIAIEKHNQEMEFQRNEEMRKQYGQNIVEMTDKLRSRVEDLIAKKNADRSTLTTIESLVKTLDLDSDPYWRNAPASARDSVFEYVRGIAAEDRANRSQNNADRAAQDTHDISRQNLKDLKLRIEDYKAEKDAREKEYKLRELRADLESVLAEDDITLYDFQRSLEFDSDGNVKLTRRVSERVKRAWSRIADTIGVRLLGDLLSGLVKVGG